MYMLFVCGNVKDKIGAEGDIVRTTTIVRHDAERVVCAFLPLCGPAE